MRKRVLLLTAMAFSASAWTSGTPDRIVRESHYHDASRDGIDLHLDRIVDTTLHLTSPQELRINYTI